MKTKFSGQIIGEELVNSSGRWSEISLYRTNDNKYIAQYILGSSLKGFKDEIFGCICKTEKEVKTFFTELKLNNEHTARLYSAAGFTLGE